MMISSARPREPDVAVLVDVRRVAGVVDAGNLLPVVAAVALGLAPERRRQAGERPLDHHDPLLVRPRTARPSGVTTAASMPGSGIAAEPGLIGSIADAVRIAEDRTAGLGLPHVIDDRHAVVEDRVLQPLPGRRVEHLAGADDALEPTNGRRRAAARRRSASASGRRSAR